MWEFEELMILPGTEQERDWLAERLSTLSKKEKHIVSHVINKVHVVTAQNHGLT